MAKVFVTVDEIKEESRFIDTRFSLTNADEGLQLYKEGHMNGAVYWDLNRDLSDMTSKEGRHPMPKKSNCNHYLSALACVMKISSIFMTKVECRLRHVLGIC